MMKTLISFALLITTFFMVTPTAQAQKNVQTFTISHLINAPAEKVWKVVGEDYGAIAHSHPKIVSSDYINGSLKAGEGAERVCYFNEKGTQFLKEKQTNFDPENYTFRNQVFQAGKFPVDPKYTYAIYKVEAVDENTTRFTFDMTFRTKPAFLGWFMKRSFKKLIEDYAIAVEHYVNTGEEVNQDNFKTIKKQYATR